MKTRIDLEPYKAGHFPSVGTMDIDGLAGTMMRRSASPVVQRVWSLLSEGKAVRVVVAGTRERLTIQPLREGEDGTRIPRSREVVYDTSGVEVERMVGFPFAS